MTKRSFIIATLIWVAITIGGCVWGLPFQDELQKAHQEYINKKAHYSKEYVDAINEKGFDFETVDLKDLAINTYLIKNDVKTYTCPLESNRECDVVRTTDDEILVYEVRRSRWHGHDEHHLLFKFKKDNNGKLHAETVEYNGR